MTGVRTHDMERTARVGDIELCHETFGDPGDDAVLLIMGLGTQMLAWHEDFCSELAGRGFHVIRFDNRDTGRSTKMQGRPPGPLELLRRTPKHPAYTLDDLADDAAGLLGALGIDAAHVVGASMGGMIAQQLAVRHPHRVRSLVSIMSTTGKRGAGEPSYRVYGTLLRSPPRDRDGYVEYIAKLAKLIGSPGHPRDEDEVRQMAGRTYDRGIHPAGTGRQLGAILASGDRSAQLARISCPTTVIHGTKDLMVDRSGGTATADAIPGARLVEIDGMGHDLPRTLWPRLIEEIVATAGRAGRALAA